MHPSSAMMSFIHALPVFLQTNSGILLLGEKRTIKTQSKFAFDWISSPPSDCVHYNIVKVHWNESLHAIVPALCLWCYQDPTSEYYLWCVSSSQCTTAVRLFLSTFNSNLAHYSQTTKALSVHSGAHGSEWWIFPITLLSIQVSGKHRAMETALEKPCSYVCLTTCVLGNVSTISTKTSKLKGKVKYPKSNTNATLWQMRWPIKGETYNCSGICLQICECCHQHKLQTKEMRLYWQTLYLLHGRNLWSLWSNYPVGVSVSIQCNRYNCKYDTLTTSSQTF